MIREILRLSLYHFQVTSPYGNNLYHQENVTHGQFAFTTSESGSYLACFWLDGQHQGGESTSISLDWRTGIAARDWESVARKEKIEVSSYKSSVDLNFCQVILDFNQVIIRLFFLLHLSNGGCWAWAAKTRRSSASYPWESDLSQDQVLSPHPTLQVAHACLPFNAGSHPPHHSHLGTKCHLQIETIGSVLFIRWIHWHYTVILCFDVLVLPLCHIKFFLLPRSPSCYTAQCLLKFPNLFLVINIVLWD